MKYFEDTNILIGTPQIIGFVNVEKVLELLRTHVLKNGFVLSVEESVKTSMVNEYTKDLGSLYYTKLLYITNEISYKELIRRKHSKYCLLEAVLKIASVFGLGVLNVANNTKIIIHLKCLSELYPCTLELTHHASGKLGLRISQKYDSALFFTGTFLIM